MSLLSKSTILFRGMPKTGAGIPVRRWTASMPMRFSVVRSTSTMAMAITITASAMTMTVAKLKSESTSKCEAGEAGARDQSANIMPTFTSNCPIFQHQNHPTPLPMPMILASSPSSTSMIHVMQPDAATIEQSAANYSRKWWRFQWCREKGSKRATSWWQRIGQTFFVITRGIEIVVRLSPLVILAPTSVAVSIIEKKCISLGFFKERGRDDLKPLLTMEGLGRSDDDRDDVFAEQFQDSSSSLMQQKYHHTSNWASNLAWRYTLHTLQSLGPAFVKLGQWAATRRDLFPVHMCNHLSKLHDTARIHEWKYTHEALVEAFGEDYESRGLVVMRKGKEKGVGNSSNNKEDDGILGSGSAAQVHKGTLTTTSGNDNNQLQTRTVAIKVLHPNTRQLVERDLALMQHVADFIDVCIPLEMVKMLSLPRAVSNFANVMERQVDLRIEGDNLRIFRDNFGCTDYIKENRKSPPTITFPCPEQEWITERVLVEEHAGDDAVPISKYLANDSPEGLKIRKRLAGPLLRAFLKMVFVDNFIHADLHPGNVLVRAAPNASNPKRVNYTIIFLDAGIATSLHPNDKRNLHDLFKSVVLNDGYTAGSLMIERARYERCSSMPGGKHAFALGVGGIVSEFHDRRKQGLTLGAVRVGALLGQVLDLCRRYGVEIDPAMSSVVVSMLVLEGLGRSLDSDLNLMKAAMPFLLGRGRV